MANTFALTLKAQNGHAASTVLAAVTQKMPDLISRETGLQSAIAEFTSGASNTLAIGASGIVTVTGTTQKDPVTAANLNFTYHRGLFIVVDRADADTAPTLAADAIASTTSLAIGTGSKAFTVASGLTISNAPRFRAVSATGGGANWMEGTISYSSTTATMTVDTVSGSGTLADWTIYGLPVAQITNTGFGITNSTALNLYEGSALALFFGGTSIVSSVERALVKAVNTQTLTVSLAGVTGLKVSVFAIGE